MNAQTSPASERPGPLAGVRVVEVADEQAEYCGLLLGGLGAEVIKVEPPGGNSTRQIGPFYQDVAGPERSLFFWHYNRTKRSVVLDLDDAADRARFRQLNSARNGSSPPAGWCSSRRHGRARQHHDHLSGGRDARP